MIVYSPGEGPVPFTYSAEAFVSLPFNHYRRRLLIMLAPLHPRHRHVLRNSHNVGFQLHRLADLAVAQ
jgi:hypothetical protein